MCQLCNIDVNKKEEFAMELMDIVNKGTLALMISVGHRTGLYDVMSQLEAPATSAEIAEAAGLNERYVREWLGAMSTGRIVECDPDGPRFSLPAERAAMLTREAGADNLAVLMQYMSVLGGVEDEIVDCFKKGGGVPYASYPRFHDVMAEESSQTAGFVLFDHVLPLAPGLIEALESGINVLDCGCGQGRTLVMMARAYPNSTFVGFDLSAEAIAVGRSIAAELGLENIRFEQRDLSTFDQDAPEEEFDFIATFDAVHDQARPDNLLKGIHRALKADGVYIMQDIKGSSNVWENLDHPLGPLFYSISTLHCMTVSLAQGGMGLGAMWGRQKALEMIDAAGFGNVDVKELDHDIINYYYIVTK